MLSVLESHFDMMKFSDAGDVKNYLSMNFIFVKAVLRTGLPRGSFFPRIGPLGKVNEQAERQPF